MNLEAGLTRLLTGSTCIVGMGNYFRCDDAAGLAVVDALSSALGGRGPQVVNVEDILESYVFFIDSRPCDNVLLVDAVEAGLPEGAVVFGELSELREITQGISSHKLALETACRIFRDGGKGVYLLGIAVRNADYGEGLSPVIAGTTRTLAELMLAIIENNDNVPADGLPGAALLPEHAAPASPMRANHDIKRSM